ncbi:MAG: LysE family transporter [Anaerolineae bacterium]|jgi:threonine/homoserine/homoserine lactone efflux protein
MNTTTLVSLLKGLVLGFSIAMPVGPIGVLCIHRTLARGRASGLVSGLGAATADAVYGSIAGFGLTFISGFLVRQQTWLSFAGGIFLCYLGLRTFLAPPAEQRDSDGKSGLVSAYASTFFLTLTNPMTILSFTLVFAGLGGVGADGNYATAGLLVLGVFVGSGLWWLFLSGGVSLFRERFSLQGLAWLNKVSGLMIVGLGLSVLLRLIK